MTRLLWQGKRVYTPLPCSCGPFTNCIFQIFGAGPTFSSPSVFQCPSGSIQDLTSLSLKIYLFLCLWVFHLHISTPCVCLLHSEAGGKHQAPWNWSERWLEAALWVLGTEPGSSARTASALTTGRPHPTWSCISVAVFLLFPLAHAHFPGPVLVSPEEPLPLFLCPQIQQQWLLYTIRLDHMMEDALRLNVKWSLLELSKAINGDGKTTPNPLFRVLVILQNDVRGGGSQVRLPSL